MREILSEKSSILIHSRIYHLSKFKIHTLTLQRSTIDKLDTSIRDFDLGLNKGSTFITFQIRTLQTMYRIALSVIMDTDYS
jgi:hypothetical protein